MLKTFAVILVAASSFLLGVGVSPTPKPDAHDAAAIPNTPTLICNGQFNCGQYILQIDSQRGFGPAFELYQVSGNAIDTTNFQRVTSGFPSLTFQATEPETRTDQTFTVTAGEP